jgi:hypothetical protein
MDNSEPPAIPLLLRYARPALRASVAYRYDPELEISVVTDPGGAVRPAVNGPDSAILTKSQTVIQGED